MIDQQDLFTPPSSRAFRFDGDPLGSREREVETAFDPVPVSRATMAAKVAAFFRARPNQWIDGRELMPVAGSYGWRTRISDCRRAPYKMQIDNRQRRVRQYIVSEYRYVPPDPDLGGAA